MWLATRVVGRRAWKEAHEQMHQLRLPHMLQDVHRHMLQQSRNRCRNRLGNRRHNAHHSARRGPLSKFGVCDPLAVI